MAQTPGRTCGPGERGTEAGADLHQSQKGKVLAELCAHTKETQFKDVGHDKSMSTIIQKLRHLNINSLTQQKTGIRVHSIKTSGDHSGIS